MKAAAVLLLSVLLASCGCIPPVPPADVTPGNWPSYTPNSAWQPLVSAAIAQYASTGFTYRTNLQDYSPSGDYLNFSLTDFWRNIPDREQLDANGVPMINYNGTFFYNPVTTAEFALSEHGKFLRGMEPDLTKFWAGVNKLLELQSADGSFQYPFDFAYFQNSSFFHAPWTSGMSQGMSLSVFSRAWTLTGDPKFLDAGNRAFRFMSRTVSEGGDTEDLHFLDASLTNYIIIDEYPAQPSAYTLNGFMFAMLGLYDWSQLPESGASRASAAQFRRCLDTLDHILPYYDAGGFTTYDMGHMTYGHTPHLDPCYHSIHIYLLHALGSITNDPALSKYEMLWRLYVPQ